MLYLYKHHKLKPLKLSHSEAIAMAKKSDALLISNNIKEMIEISTYEKCAFLLHSKNKYTLFSYCLLQLKHGTFREFRTILFSAQHGLLYHFLNFASVCSFRYYDLIDFKATQAKL